MIAHAGQLDWGTDTPAGTMSHWPAPAPPLVNPWTNELNDFTPASADVDNLPLLTVSDPSASTTSTLSSGLFGLSWTTLLTIAILGVAGWFAYKHFFDK